MATSNFVRREDFKDKRTKSSNFNLPNTRYLRGVYNATKADQSNLALEHSGKCEVLPIAYRASADVRVEVSQPISDQYSCSGLSY
ncbi:hypothetical protein ACTXT7_016249 [Hymenolepis weldensis]